MLIDQHQTRILHDLIDGRQTGSKSLSDQGIGGWLGNHAVQGKFDSDNCALEDRGKWHPLVQSINGVEMKEIIQSIDQTHLISVGQEIHGHNGVNERTSHAFIVPRHYRTATQCDYRCIQ